MKKKKRMQLLAFIGLSVIVLSAAVLYGVRYGTQPVAGPGTEAEQDSVSGRENIPVSASTEEEKVRILLEQNGSSASGEGVQISGNTVSIRQGGTYVISGTLEDGQIYVDVGSDEEVFLIFSGVDIRNASEAAVYVENAGHTIIVLEEGTENLLQSGEEVDFRAVEDGADDNASGAALYARDDLSVSGTCSLHVYGYINNGIHTTNRLLIESGTIFVEARNNGIKGKDSVRITGGDFTVFTGGDGIKSDDTTGDGYGTVFISGGTFSIESSSDGIQAETRLEISGGSFKVVSGGGSEDVVFLSERGWGFPDSGWDMSEEAETSAKGFKCGTEMILTGGEITVDSRDDAFHSNGSVLISGGVFWISTGDDGIHADTELTVEDGSICIVKSYEGLEANRILCSGGDITVTASDDGINAYGGKSRWGWGGLGKTTEETPELRITGGNVTIDAKGDGLDSNGNLSVEGGLVIVDGPSDNGNGAIDSGSENGGICTVSGGTVIALGSSGMAETFDNRSEQYSFCHTFDRAFGAGDEITVTDEQGNTLFSHTAVKSGNSVVFSSPELERGKTYVLDAGGQRAEITIDSISTISGRRGGRGGRFR
ncbi:MAG: carbohydrate-binding domain-containing protein [bacterium]|nr:carbohydrate-binding domain-containing protein [bacterium]